MQSLTAASAPGTEACEGQLQRAQDDCRAASLGKLWCAPTQSVRRKVCVTPRQLRGDRLGTMLLKRRPFEKLLEKVESQMSWEK